jgi:hypothetical protein
LPGAVCPPTWRHRKLGAVSTAAVPVFLREAMSEVEIAVRVRLETAVMALEAALDKVPDDFDALWADDLADALRSALWALADLK